jgi:hypothetical protein
MVFTLFGKAMYVALAESEVYLNVAGRLLVPVYFYCTLRA